MPQQLLHTLSTGYRGRDDHAVRQQIIDAARTHFAQHGYTNTSVLELAKAIGFSKAYIYKFFDSKRAIGEALCAQVLTELLGQAQQASQTATSANNKLQQFFLKLIQANATLCMEQPRLCELALDVMRERWAPGLAYVTQIEQNLQVILQQGRDEGTFDDQASLEETARAVARTLEIYSNPLILQFKLDELPDGPIEILRLILRSLQKAA